MSGQTVTRADLCEAVYQKIGLSRTEASKLVETVLDEICDAVARGENVKLSSFGSFVVRGAAARQRSLPGRRGGLTQRRQTLLTSPRLAASTTSASRLRRRAAASLLPVGGVDCANT